MESLGANFVSPCIFTYVTPRSRILPEKLTVPQLVKKFSAHYETPKVHHFLHSSPSLDPSPARSMQSKPPNSLYLLQTSFKVCWKSSKSVEKRSKMNWKSSKSVVKWNEVKWREREKNETLCEKVIWVVKWWEVKGWGERVSTICVGEKYWELYTVLSYLGVVYLLYMLYFKTSCVYCC